MNIFPDYLCNIFNQFKNKLYLPERIVLMFNIYFLRFLGEHLYQNIKRRDEFHF